MGSKFVVVDLETTGNSAKKGDKIIQFAAVVIENGKIVDQFSSLVNPEQSIPIFIEELTGLNDEMVKDAPLFSEIAPKILMLLDDAYFVAHNVLFDLSFLQDELTEEGYEGFYGPVLDTVELARILFPTADSYKLSDLALREGLDHDRPHQADSDAFATAELLNILIKRMQSLPEKTLKQLLKLSGGLKSDISLLIDEIVLDKERVIEELSETIEIYRGIALKKSVRCIDVPEDDPTPYPFNNEQKAEMLKQAFPSFEIRDGQFQMMDSVFRAFVNNRHALIEAGTGVGKSLGYLVPAAIFAKERNETIVISTYTTQLQEQLLSKDIPLLQKMLPFRLNTVLLKGRGHYISLAKFEQSLREEDDNYDTTLTKMQILVWLTETETGDNDELNLSSGGLLFWNKIKNDESLFVQTKSWLSKDFYLKARKDAQKADIIITNHSLLLSDVVAENAIFPPYDYVVIDEGHHFEKAAGKYFGSSLDYLSTRLQLGQFGLYEQKQYFYKLLQLLKEKELDGSHGLLHSFEASRMTSELLFEMDEFFKAVCNFAKKKAKRSIHRISIRLKEDEHSREWKNVLFSAERFLFSLKDLLNYLKKSLSLLKGIKESLTEDQLTFLEDLAGFTNDVEGICEKTKMLILKPSAEYVTWIEMDTRAIQNTAAIYAQPVAVSNYLKEQFFTQKKSAIITSATLSVKNSFKYMAEELGLNLGECHLERIDSPFNYHEQVQLIIPDDLPEINAVPLEEYVTSITEHIISIAEAAKGRMLILFTSHDMLRKTYDLMKESGLLEDYAIIAQGISGGSRTRLTRNFQRFDKAILLGTSSFWEGVDIPGEDLSCLIIVRLPFSPPDEPITEAKCNRIKQSGGNPFSDHSLPEAIIRFKRGFGRLIRTETDKGFIIVFDRRLVTTKYGKAFLQSIPTVSVKREDINGIVELIESRLQ